MVTARPIRKRIDEEDPFAPSRQLLGSFLYKPALEVTAGYNSNPGQRLNGGGSTGIEKVAPELLLRKSNWSQHELSRPI